MRKLNRFPLNYLGKPIKELDVRPLDKREQPLNSRKGMTRVDNQHNNERNMVLPTWDEAIAGFEP